MNAMEELIRDYMETRKKFEVLADELKKLCREIFKYFKEKYQEFLEFEQYSAYTNYRLDADGLTIIYYDREYDLYEDNAMPTIPIDRLPDEKWKAFLDEWVEEKYRERHDRLLKEQKELELAERKRYEELKKKFEK